LDYHQAGRDEALRNYDTVSYKNAKVESVKQIDDGTFEGVAAMEKNRRERAWF